MILKGSQRGGGAQLALHLLNERENDHVLLHEMRGFLAQDLRGALDEAHAVSKGTRCKQFMFSLSVNPPKQGDCTIDGLMEAVELAEERLGLSGQPRAVVIHEKEGRRHVHVVWSRINVERMKAVEMPFFKNRLCTLSKELYLKHEWDLPEGHRENGWRSPLNFTLAEWQQAKRTNLDPREVRHLVQEAYRLSDGLKSLRAALADRGYFLAKGDRRGFVVVDLHNSVHALARLLDEETRAVEGRLGTPDGLPSVDTVQKELRERMSGHLSALLNETRARREEALRPLERTRKEMVTDQRLERERLRLAQEARQERERALRQARFRTGIAGLWDIVTGRAAALRRENERDAFLGYRRDVEQREALFGEQMRDRVALQREIEQVRAEHRDYRRAMSEHISHLLRGEWHDAMVPAGLQRWGLPMTKVRVDFNGAAARPDPADQLTAASRAAEQRRQLNIIGVVVLTPAGHTRYIRTKDRQSRAERVPTVDRTRMAELLKKRALWEENNPGREHKFEFKRGVDQNKRRNI